MSWLTPRIPPLPDHYTPWTRKELLVAGIVALVVVSTLGVTVVAPAEYGADPTGVGHALRLTELNAPPTTPPEPHGPEVNVTPLVEFPYRWPTSNVLVYETSGELLEGESTTVSVDVTPMNVTRVTAFLSWQDAALIGDPQPDTFTLALAGPTGQTSASGSNAGATGSVVANVTASAAPPPGNVSAEDESGARAAIFAGNPTRAEGTGAWTATITLDDVADLVGDDGNTWRLQVFVETFRLELGDQRSTPIQEVTVTLALAANGPWEEYKVEMQEGATLTYDWQATGDLQWDFHGLDMQTGKETSHATGTSAGEVGELVTPFWGHHGWAWRNRGSTDVQVTVTLRGPFVLIA